MKINEVAKMTGVTIRTLHYYDQIGLLKPSKVTEKGYRLYDEKSLEILQQILFFRELDFPLNKIKEIINDPKFDSKKALMNHKELLIKKRERLDRIINLVDQLCEGDKKMSFKEFDSTEIEKCRVIYAKETEEKYGNTDQYKESNEKMSKYTKDDFKAIEEEGNAIMKEFYNNRNEKVDSKQVMKLVEKWQNYITKYYYKCTKQILSGLGLMYINDERFKNNIDKNGIGTADFMSIAIENYCK